MLLLVVLSGDTNREQQTIPNLIVIGIHKVDSTLKGLKIYVVPFYIPKWNARMLSLKQIVKELKSYKNTNNISDYAITIPWTERTEWNIQHSYFSLVLLLSLDAYSTDLFLTDDRRKKVKKPLCHILSCFVHFNNVSCYIFSNKKKMTMTEYPNCLKIQKCPSVPLAFVPVIQ